MSSTLSSKGARDGKSTIAQGVGADRIGAVLFNSAVFGAVVSHKMNVVSYVLTVRSRSPVPLRASGGACLPRSRLF
jgi:hypothetical protein